MNFKCHKPNSKIVAYIPTTFAYALMHNIFSFYYVKIFLNFYHVSSSWFQFAQVVFMIWNTINDPLFGYFQDNSNWKIFKNRRFSVLYGAPFYGLSFLVAWFPLGNYQENTPAWVVGVHLIAALCLYDTMFSFVLLAHCSLFAEMSVDYRGRLEMKWWSVLAHLFAGISVPLANHTSDNLACLTCFRVTCIGVAIVSTVCMIFTGLKAKTIYEDNFSDRTEKVSQGSIFKLTKEIIMEKDFHGFVWLNFLHQGHSVFQNNFASIFLDFLVPGLSTQFLNVYFALLWTLPPLTIILFRSFIEMIGYYRIIKIACLIKMAASLIIWISGQASYVFLVYLLLDNVVLHSISNLFDIVLSDIVDKDLKIHNRKQPISSMIFATNALITKPAISLFPMVIVAILNYNGYHEIVKNLSSVSGSQIRDIGMAQVIFNLACWVPFLVGLLQFISWSFFTIRGSHKCQMISVETN